MTLFESWKDSLKLCKIEAIKLFALVTLKSCYEVIRVLMVAWFLIPLIFFVCLATLIKGVEGFIGGVNFAGSVASIFFLIAARPSVGIKDFTYFRVNMLRALWLILISQGLAILIGLPIYAAVFSSVGILSFVMFIIFAMVVLLLVLMPGLTELTILFYLDYPGDNIFSAFKRALTMIWYNYPLFIIYLGLFNILNFLIALPVVWLLAPFVAGGITIPWMITSLVSTVWNLCFNLFTKCLLVNLYIKRMHDQSELYIR